MRGCVCWCYTNKDGKRALPSLFSSLRVANAAILADCALPFPKPPTHHSMACMGRMAVFRAMIIA